MMTILYNEILCERPNAAAVGAYSIAIGNGATKAEASRAASEAANDINGKEDNSDIFPKGDFKNDYQKIYENYNKPSDVFDRIKYGFDDSFSYKAGKRNTEWSNVPEIILEFVRDTSKGFQSDVAAKALEYGNPSEKQSWAISYEFIKLKNKYPNWVRSRIKKYKLND